MSDDSPLLSPRERARLRSRDRKIRGPRVIVDNPGLKKLVVDLANRRRRQIPPTGPPGHLPRKGPARGDEPSPR